MEGLYILKIDIIDKTNNKNSIEDVYIHASSLKDLQIKLFDNLYHPDVVIEILEIKFLNSQYSNFFS